MFSNRLDRKGNKPHLELFLELVSQFLFLVGRFTSCSSSWSNLVTSNKQRNKKTKNNNNNKKRFTQWNISWPHPLSCKSTRTATISMFYDLIKIISMPFHSRDVVEEHKPQIKHKLPFSRLSILQSVFIISFKSYHHLGRSIYYPPSPPLHPPLHPYEWERLSQLQCSTPRFFFFVRFFLKKIPGDLIL